MVFQMELYQQHAESGIYSFLSDVTLFTLSHTVLAFSHHSTLQIQTFSLSYLPTSLSSLLHLRFHLPVIPSQMHSQAALFSKLSLL